MICFLSSILNLTYKMASKYYSTCIKKLSLSCFLLNTTSSPSSQVFNTYIQCWQKVRQTQKAKKANTSSKRPALQPLDLNIRLSKRLRTRLKSLVIRLEPLIPPSPLTTLPPTRPTLIPLVPLPLTVLALALLAPYLKPLILALIPLILIPPILTLVLLAPYTEPFLSISEQEYIQNFNQVIEDVQIETCLYYRERQFDIQLKDNIYQHYYLRDIDISILGRKQTLSLFLMSIDNEIDLGDVLAYLLALIQIEEIVIT